MIIVDTFEMNSIIWMGKGEFLTEWFALVHILFILRSNWFPSITLEMLLPNVYFTFHWVRICGDFDCWHIPHKSSSCPAEQPCKLGCPVLHTHHQIIMPLWELILYAIIWSWIDFQSFPHWFTIRKSKIQYTKDFQNL